MFFEAIFYFSFSSTTLTVIRDEHPENSKISMTTWIQKQEPGYFTAFAKIKTRWEKKKKGSICQCSSSSISGYVFKEFMCPSASGPSCFCFMPFLPFPLFWFRFFPLQGRPLQPCRCWSLLFLPLHHTVYFNRTFHVKSQRTHAGVYDGCELKL